MSFRTIAFGILFICLALQSATMNAQTKDDKKEEPKKAEEQKKADPAKSDEKNPEAKKADEKKADSVYNQLKAKLKSYEDDLAKIRAAMLKDVEVEEKRIDDLIVKLEKVRMEASKLKDFKTSSETVVMVGKLRSERNKIAMLRYEIDRKVNPTGGTLLPVRKLNEEERLGIGTSSPATVLAQQLGLKKDVGVVIDRVDPNSVADKVGLKKYDVLVKLDGNTVTSAPFAFRKQLAQLKADTPVEAIVIRNGKEEMIKGLTIPAPK